MNEELAKEIKSCAQEFLNNYMHEYLEVRKDGQEIKFGVFVFDGEETVEEIRLFTRTLELPGMKVGVYIPLCEAGEFTQSNVESYVYDEQAIAEYTRRKISPKVYRFMYVLETSYTKNEYENLPKFYIVNAVGEDVLPDSFVSIEFVRSGSTRKT